MSRKLSDFQRDCWYAAPGREAWYDPRVMTVYLDLEEEPDFSSREEAVTHLAEEKGWVFDHEMWHSQCSKTTAMEAVFLLNNSASTLVSNLCPVERKRGSKLSYIKVLDRYARLFASSSELPMEAYALTMDDSPEESNRFEHLNMDVERLSSELGEEKGADLVSTAAWKALNPDLAGDQGIHKLVQRLSDGEYGEDWMPERRFTDSLDYITRNRAELKRKDVKPYSEIPLETAENSLIVEDCPSSYTIKPEKVKSLVARHVDEGALSELEDRVEELQPTHYWVSFVFSLGTRVIWEALEEISGPLYFCLRHPNRTLYILNPEIEKASFDHKAAYNILCSHFQKEKYLIEHDENPNGEGEVRLSEEAEYVPFDRKDDFTPSSNILRLFKADNTNTDASQDAVSLLRKAFTT